MFPFHSSAIVLNAVVNSFKPEFISQRAMMFAEMIKDCEETGLPKVGGRWLMYPVNHSSIPSLSDPLLSDPLLSCTHLLQYKLYVSLGNCVVLADPPQKDRLPLLNTVRMSSQSW